jgi:hypothetical protein
MKGISFSAAREANWTAFVLSLGAALLWFLARRHTVPSGAIISSGLRDLRTS